MRKFHVIIWVGGIVDANNIMGLLPNSCVIDTFVETNKSSEDIWGIRVISANEFADYYSKCDTVIVASDDYELIMSRIEDEMGVLRNCFYFEKAAKVFCPADGRGWFSAKQIFDERIYYARQQMYMSPYVVCNVGHTNIVVNSVNRMFLNTLLTGDMFQEEDIKNYMRLCEMFYGIPLDTDGYFVDIGANIGTTCIYVKRSLNPKLKVIAFEMEHENCKQLKASMVLNDIPESEMTIVEAAVSNKEGEAVCMLSGLKDNMGDHRVIINDNYNDGWETEKISTVRLDDYVAYKNIKPEDIKYIWMDVQGHEAFVLDGAIDILKKNAIPVILEFWPQELKRNKTDQMILSNVSESEYTSFVVMESLGGKKSNDWKDLVRPISEMKKLFSEYEDKSCDVFLIK